MMSCPCGRIWAGNSGGTAPEPSQPVTFRTEIEESIHVSRTSASPSHSSEPQAGQGFCGRSRAGSTGRSSISGTMKPPQSRQTQTGMGVAKMRWRDMHQSHSIWDVQFSSRVYICAGIQEISCAAAMILSGRTLTNHWRSLMISIGVLQRQQVPRRCSISSCRLRVPSAAMSPRIASRHSARVMPAYLPAIAVILPCLSIALRRSRSCCFHQCTSCLSPKVQIITAPLPNSGSTASSATTGTSCPKYGTFRLPPLRPEYLSSPGWTATATHAARSSGRVVAISTPSKSK